MSARLKAGILFAWLALLVGLTVWSGTVAFSWVGKPFNGFLVQPMLYVSPYQHAGWEVGQHGLVTLDTIAKVEGRPVRNTEELLARAREVPVGTPLAYEVWNGPSQRVVQVPTRLFTMDDFTEVFAYHHAIAWELALIGMVLFWLRPNVPAARALIYLVASLSLILLIYFDLHYQARMSPIFVVNYALLGSFFAHLALHFPRRSRWLDRIPALNTVVWGIGGLIAAGYLLFYLHEGPAVSEASRYARGIGVVLTANIWTSIGMVAMFVAIVRGLWVSPKGSLERRQAALALVGAAVGLAPLLTWYVAMVTGLGPSISVRMGLYALALFPAGIAYAIVRGRLFDISVVVRNSVLYLGLSLLLACAYVVLATAMRVLLPGQSLVEGLVSTMLVVALFVPARDALQALIDRRLFRDAYDAQRALEEASRSMTTLLDAEAIVARMRETVDSTMRPVVDEVYLLSEDGRDYRASGGAALPIDHPLVAELAGRQATPLQSPKLDGLAADLAVPLVFQGRLLGIWLLGAKRSEAAYTEPDLRLLTTLANQSAIALSNAQAYERIQRFNRDLEEQVRSRTLELEQALAELKRTQAQLIQTEKMGAIGQLVGGIAHELNNPLTFVYGGTELLELKVADLRRIAEAYLAGVSREELDALRRELGAENLHEELAELTAACREGAVRAQAIVRSLRDFSRLDDFAKEPVALKACVESALPLIAPSFKGRVVIHTEMTEVPRVLGSAIHLGQVIMNLVVNACQAIADEGQVWVRLRPHAEGVALEVEDTGTGIAAADRDRLFEPFFTTKPVGVGTGMGLSICHGIVEQHGGRIEVASRPGEGSVFRVILPAWVEAEACERS